jgi:hypothetical protein
MATLIKPGTQAVWSINAAPHAGLSSRVSKRSTQDLSKQKPTIESNQPVPFPHGRREEANFFDGEGERAKKT